ncbi:MAG: glycoside hydrolase family 38 [Caldilineaceae bacterium]|jgi:alpha-mannosidase/mannosylglycerate hydrolase|nr:glycoside hydrolase family 38 [Caldilineaceae bacterium]
MTTSTRLRAHYVLSTHWDREWYQSFQNYRYQLVNLLDRVLAAQEDGRLRGPFQTDGQAIILEDYLEIRPERRGQIARLAQAGKLVIGPWYVLPDEFLVSGEALIRNLRLGRQIARSFGVAPSNAGFVCDLFGHNSQMPQIFAGFGIHGALIWRGLNHLQTRHVRWRGADGTELAAYRFPGGGYCDYTFKVRHALEHGVQPDAAQVQADLDAYLHDEAEHTEVDPILLFDGGDHEEWDEAVYTAMLAYADQAGDDFELVHTSLDAYLAEVLPQVTRIGAVVAGELREPGRDYDDQQWVIPGVLSSRVWIKQANAECQTLLCQWAEPFSAWAHLALHVEAPQGFLDVAWKWLLQNHPHDSICGCSIDIVHEDMKFRFSQTKQIADRLTREATQQLAASIEGDLTDDDLRVVIFNPLTHTLQETVELTLQIPTHWPHFNEFFGFEPKPAFRIYDAQGHEVAYQRLNQFTNRRKVRLHTIKFPEAYRTHDITVSLPIRLPALGYTTLTVRAERSGHATRHPLTPALVIAENAMENELLRVTIETNGTLTLQDKRNGAIYHRLLTYADCADIGDGWYHGQAVNDQVFVSTATSAAVALVCNGPHVATFRVRTTLAVPAAFHFDDRMRRADELVELVIDSLISLRPGCDRVEVESTVHNVASDHRLQVLFPTGAKTETYLADTPFDVVERPIPLRADNHLYRELEVETRPQQSWTAIFDAQRGLAVISAGLLESAIQNGADRTLALTLYRSTQRTVFTDGEPEGQLLGKLSFRYWLTPLTGAPDRVRLARLGQQIAAGLRAVQLRPADLPLHRQATSLPPTASLLEVDGPAVVTSARWLAEGLEVRLFNPTIASGHAVIRFPSDVQVTTVQEIDFESQPIGEAQNLSQSEAVVALAAKQIKTLRFA